MSDGLTRLEWTLITGILLLVVVFLVSGCTILWTDDAFYLSCFKDIDFDRVAKDPNSLIIERYKGQTDNIQAVTPYGIMETK